jgi:hypothetical protein
MYENVSLLVERMPEAFESKDRTPSQEKKGEKGKKINK